MVVQSGTFIPLEEKQGFLRRPNGACTRKSRQVVTHSGLLGNVIPRVSVNISAVEYNRESAIQRIDYYLQLNPEFVRYLCLEITETAALSV
ncbi:hypothetical protein BZG78_13155 [Salinivibrio sp. MA351]|uniref:hypothetical protein n=1 Tax=unclassified Salinivibrio TaxID=2636825 RepID=UPI000988DBA4|nr:MULTISPECIES: hypothetical protein [unclassified Salinivibrio]OOE96791.1 hypothetical protein BZG78_13155 [Salinivibrio sp. MA351]OOF01676.1 hypothetical protein BZG80_14945 [Salinivibrio sp. MA440]